ncbi:MAG: rod-binding protein [Proteobacteria bacterium]|nr:rod-binding protein [Pseudomonadota bacterium]MBU4471529.1 rod-binding protein [Pseudomonadota bacterium]MCG2752535.1 rod-binding protein [Desulfobacteraceae bacterium]
MTQPVSLSQYKWQMPETKNLFGMSKNMPKSISCDNSHKEMESEKLKKVCQAFESLFVAQVMKEMRATVPKNELFDGGQAEEIYTSMLDEKLSEEIATNGSLGLAKKLYESLSETLANSKFEGSKA